MATKAKTETAPKSTPVPAQAAPSPHAIAYAKAVKLVDTGKYPEAVKALEALMSEAQETGDWAVKRRAQVYLLLAQACLLYTSPSPRDRQKSRMPSSA